MKTLVLVVFCFLWLGQTGCKSEASGLLIEVQGEAQVTSDRSEIAIQLTNRSTEDIYLPKYFAWVKINDKSIICKTDHYYFNQFTEEDLDHGLMNTFFHIAKGSIHKMKFDLRQACFDLHDGKFEITLIFPVSNEAVREYAVRSYVLERTNDRAERDYLASQIIALKKVMKTEYLEKALVVELVGFSKKK